MGDTKIPEVRVASMEQHARDESFHVAAGRKRSTSTASSGSSAEHRNSRHHRSFLFTSSDPSNTILQQSARQLFQRRLTFQSPFYGNKVQPALSEDAPRHHHKRAEMQTFPLRFKDLNLDEIFRKHFNMYVLRKVRIADLIVIVMNGGLLLGQYGTRPESYREAIFVSRVILIVLALWFYGCSFFPFFQRYFDFLVFLHYFVHGIVVALPRYFKLKNYWVEDTSDNILEKDTLFCTQKSVRTMSLLYFLLVFNASGMRFTTATICTLCTITIKLFFIIVFCKECSSDDFETMVKFAVIGLCALASYYGERHVRTEFVERLSVAEERKRRDDLLETMLPVHIKENLKQKRTDDLAEYYEEVSILFCYISNFQVLSKHASAIDLVKVMNRIVFCFDKATDARGVYKVEAIAETYMCAAGVPHRDPYHCEKVADMALTMMQICDTEQWSFNGVDIQLQIGIHSGPVVAGVVGSKTYSYHLFGDTVNTSSRVCSSCLAGKIQISERSRQLLSRSGAYIITERGMMNLKGKGTVKLFFLEGKYAQPHDNELVDVYSAFESAIEESIRRDVMTFSPHHRSDDYITYMNNIEIYKHTLVFQSKFRRKYKSQDVSPTELDLLKDVVGTAEEMEAVFRVDHDRDSIPQFLTSIQTVAAVMFVSIIVQIRNHKPLTTQASVRYAINSTILAVTLMIIYATRKYPWFYTQKERVATIGGAIAVLFLNLKILFQDSTIQDGDYLEANILYTVIFGLAIRLRFQNSVLVNLWSFLVYFVICVAHDRRTKIQLTESFLFFLSVTFLTGHFGYKREFGLRCDFLLKCTLRLEKQKCEDLLANMLPSPQYAEALMQQATIVDELAEVTLLYSDMVGFTSLGSTLKPGDVCIVLNKIYSAFDKHLDAFGIYKMDTVGDAFIVVGGLPTHKSERHHAAAIAAFAIEMLHEIERFCAEEQATLQMRIGIHTGKVVGGVVGIKKPRYLIWGHHTVIANLMESRGIPGRIQVSDDTYQHLRLCPEFHLEDRVGRVQIGENESMRTFFLAKDHQSVKNKVIKQYLQARRELNTVALAHLRKCLQLPENSPLSKQLDATKPVITKSRSFVEIIGKR